MTLLFEPFAPLFELSRDLSRFASGGPAVNAFLPTADVIVTDDDVSVVMDVPGLRVEDLNIELQDDVLTISGERPFPQHTGEKGAPQAWQRLERGYGRFERVLRVPKGLDPDKITASMADGVLTLHLPKPEARKPRRIEIASGEQTPVLEGSTNSERELAGSTA